MPNNPDLRELKKAYDELKKIKTLDSGFQKNLRTYQTLLESRLASLTYSTNQEEQNSLVKAILEYEIQIDSLKKKLNSIMKKYLN